MSALLTDNAICTVELCKLLLSPSGTWSFKAHVGEITQASSFIGEHTEYQLILTAVPRDLDQDVRKFCLWTRYKSLSRLWYQLEKIHKQLYLHGTFPEFAPSKILGRSDPGIIAERIEATNRFMTFVLASEVLRKSKALHEFLEPSSEITLKNDSVHRASLLDSTVGNSHVDPTPLVPANHSEDSQETKETETDSESKMPNNSKEPLRSEQMHET
ncbi:hypothetical protein AB6A40_010815 [Gnathostoma spinigerum]|uniref:PX domain-containing protein n=1 Tax=Gnathostoma spinigerum TaxID=75299 RepID=A0ABD6EXQ0_9BILA